MTVTLKWTDQELFSFYLPLMSHSISYGYLLKQLFQGAEDIVTVDKNLLSIYAVVLDNH